MRNFIAHINKLANSLNKNSAEKKLVKEFVSVYNNAIKMSLEKECNCEEYFLDSFDKEHLYFVALGVTTMENYIEMKKLYYKNRVDKISSLVGL